LVGSAYLPLGQEVTQVGKFEVLLKSARKGEEQVVQVEGFPEQVEHLESHGIHYLRVEFAINPSGQV
jgi:hypothetical protein